MVVAVSCCADLEQGQGSLFVKTDGDKYRAILQEDFKVEKDLQALLCLQIK